jgi:phenylpyruvate tautomerase PptA (4-oxalocrotonate tautomerase family)
MVDIFAAVDLFPVNSERTLGERLTKAVLRAEGVASPGLFHLNNTAAYVHLLPSACVQTAAHDKARTVRIQVITPPGALSRAGQKQLVAEMTQIVVEVSADPTLAQRTWVLLTEAAEGGWGIAGTAYGREEFIALAAQAKRT